MWKLKEGYVDRLRGSRPPHLHTFEGDAKTLLDELDEKGFEEYVILEASKMRSFDGLFDEFAHQLEFPDYFGHNLAGLWDCLTDLAWLERADYLLVVRDAEELLDADKDVLPVVIEYLKDAAVNWTIPSQQNQAFDHPSIPFHVIFQVKDPESAAKLKAVLQKHAGVRYWDTLNSWNSN